MRKVGVYLHRWFGLFTAVFLFISGLTGAIISWDHELDEWLNPQMYILQEGGDRRQSYPSLELANRYEASNPHLQISYMMLNQEDGHTFNAFVVPRPDPVSGKANELAFNQVALNPYTAEPQAQRMWGEISLSKENLLPFLYKLHYSMHIPDGFGIRLGYLIMGIVAIVWTLDCLISLWISFPRLSSWRKSFRFRLHEGRYKLNFDLHRSGAVWVWGLLLILAVTSISMNLETQVMRPLVAQFSELSPNEFDNRDPRALDEPAEPVFSREMIVEKAIADANARGWEVPAGGIFYSSSYDLYGVGFFEGTNDHGDGGLGNPWLYYDAKTGLPAGGVIPGEGSWGDIFLQAQFPLHSGRILGLGGRILISFMGLVVAMLSVTGLIIWARKRKARINKQARSAFYN